MSIEHSSQETRAPRILIVDDDQGQRSLLNSFLKSQGFQTVVVDSGDRALEALRSQPIQLMISDVRMPGISGLETLRRADWVVHVARSRAHTPAHSAPPVDSRAVITDIVCERPGSSSE